MLYTGKSTTKEYRTWTGMIKRCYDKKYHGFYLYGGRGISVCERWKNNFTNFLNDVGICPENKKSLDRIKNNGNYEPGNVQWATDKEQCNNRRSNVVFEIDGVTKNLLQWSVIYKMPYKTIHSRVKYCKWDIIKALTTPIQDSKYKIGHS